MQGELQRLRKEMENEVERLSHQRDSLTQKLGQTEADMQMALKQETQAHEEDVDRLSRERVSEIRDLLIHFSFSYLV